MEMNEQQYQQYVKQITPTHNVWLNMFHAFWMGGLVCTLGQLITNMLMKTGLDKDTAGKWNLLALIALAVILTGFNLFSKLAKLGGAGVLVPITGFANGIAAAAIEYKKEGQVFGIGCKIFTIAGPVILYGILTSWGLGLIYWVLTKAGVLGG